jgi:hypothetical protein
VTQWEIVVAVERISARYLIPALDDLLAQYLSRSGAKLVRVRRECLPIRKGV